jgi:hypothetical protein
MADVASVLWQLCKATGWNRKQLASLIGESPPNLYRAMSRQRVVSIDQLVRWCGRLLDQRRAIVSLTVGPRGEVEATILPLRQIETQRDTFDSNPFEDTGT